MRSILIFVFSLFLIEAFSHGGISQPLAEPVALPAKMRLYCVFVANDKDRTRDLHYGVTACPANGPACTGGTTEFVLGDAGASRARGNLHCNVNNEPIVYGIAYDFSKDDGYQERVTAVTPDAFDWRGLLPNGWCMRDAWVHFDTKGGDLFLSPGIQRGTNRGRCEWEEVYDRTKPIPDLALPEKLVGAWVEKGKACPLPGNPAERAAGVLWIQPHAIDRADGPCWLVGRFNIGRKFSTRALCTRGKGYARTTLTFDRMTDTSIRVLDKRIGRRTYTRCNDKWLPVPNQVKAAGWLAGSAHRFVFDIKTKSRIPSGALYENAHKRTFELEIGKHGNIKDRMWIDDLAPKTFQTRFGELVLDSAGDRVTWLVNGERLLRVRERAGYYEMVNWPLGPYAKSVACNGRMELIASRKDKRFYTIGTDGVKYEVLNFEWSNFGCPPAGEHVRTMADDGKKSPSGESAPAFNVLDYVPYSKQQSNSTASANDNDKCIDPKVEAAADSPKGRYSLRLRNTCPFDVVVRVVAESEPLMITELPGSSGTISLGYHFPISAEGGVAPEVVLEALEFAAMPVDAFKKSCPEIDVKQRDASLACFGKAYVSKLGTSPDQPLRTAGNRGENAPKTKSTPALDIDELLGVSKEKARPPGVETRTGDSRVSLDNCVHHSLQRRRPDTDVYNYWVVNRCRQNLMVMLLNKQGKSVITFPLEHGQETAKAVTLSGETQVSAYLAAREFRAVDQASYERHCPGIDARDFRARATCFDRAYKAIATPEKSLPVQRSQIRLRHILTKSQKDAEAVHGFVSHGLDFADAAKSLSIDKQTSGKGGDLGWVKRGQMVKVFEDTAFALKPGDISKPVETQFGWHIIKREAPR